MSYKVRTEYNVNVVLYNNIPNLNPKQKEYIKTHVNQKMAVCGKSSVVAIPAKTFTVIMKMIE